MIVVRVLVVIVEEAIVEVVIGCVVDIDVVVVAMTEEAVGAVAIVAILVVDLEEAIVEVVFGTVFDIVVVVVSIGEEAEDTVVFITAYVVLIVVVVKDADEVEEGIFVV